MRACQLIIIVLLLSCKPERERHADPLPAANMSALPDTTGLSNEKAIYRQMIRHKIEELDHLSAAANIRSKSEKKPEARSDYEAEIQERKANRRVLTEKLAKLDTVSAEDWRSFRHEIDAFFRRNYVKE